MIILKSEKTKILKKKLILSICKLNKDTHWKNGLNSTVKIFIKKYVEIDDLINLIFFNKKLVGYTLLRKRKFGTNRNNKNNYLHFADTLIVDKNYRKFGISKIINGL